MKIKSSKFTELAGWYGMLAIITAYALVSFGAISAEGLAFQIMNITGSAGLFAVALAKGVTQSVILNIFWVAIGVIATLRVIF